MPEPGRDAGDRTEEIRHIIEDPPYWPESHTSLDAMAESRWRTGLDPDTLAARRGAPRRGARRPSEYEQLMPMTHEGLTLLQVEKQLRMRHVMDGLPQASVSLLVKRHVSRMTLQAIATEEGVTPQAVAKRLETASRDFKVAFAQRWMDPLDTSLLLNDGGLEPDGEG